MANAKNPAAFVAARSTGLHVPTVRETQPAPPPPGEKNKTIIVDPPRQRRAVEYPIPARSTRSGAARTSRKPPGLVHGGKLQLRAPAGHRRPGRAAGQLARRVAEGPVVLHARPGVRGRQPRPARGDPPAIPDADHGPLRAGQLRLLRDAGPQGRYAPPNPQPAANPDGSASGPGARLRGDRARLYCLMSSDLSRYSESPPRLVRSHRKRRLPDWRLSAPAA